MSADSAGIERDIPTAADIQADDVYVAQAPRTIDDDGPFGTEGDGWSWMGQMGQREVALRCGQRQRLHQRGRLIPVVDTRAETDLAGLIRARGCDTKVTLARAFRVPLTAILITAVTLIAGCSATGADTADLQGNRQAAATARDLALDVPGSEWPSATRTATPAPTECSQNGDPHGGVQFHWNSRSTPPADPEAWINAVAANLREEDYTVSTRSTDFGRCGVLYQVNTKDEDRPAVSATANQQTSSLTVDSVCAAGDLADHDRNDSGVER